VGAFHIYIRISLVLFNLYGKIFKEKMFGVENLYLQSAVGNQICPKFAC